MGDIVLIKAINKPRPFWMMGKVLEIVMGFDGSIRSVKLKQGNGTVEYHSICNLYPLELSITHAPRDLETEISNNPVEVNINEPSEPVQVEVNRAVRPKRKAAVRFEKMLKDKIEYL